MWWEWKNMGMEEKGKGRERKKGIMITITY